MKDLTQIITEAEDYIGTNQEVVARRLEVLKKQGKLPNYLRMDEIYDLEFLDSDLQEKIALEILDLKRARGDLGYELFTGYHTSPSDLKVGSKINVGGDGKAYYSDVHSLFNRWGTVNHVYLVSAEANYIDEKEPDMSNPGRWYSRSPLTILRKWTVDEFMKEHLRANFR